MVDLVFKNVKPREVSVANRAPKRDFLPEPRVVAFGKFLERLGSHSAQVLEVIAKLVTTDLLAPQCAELTARCPALAHQCFPILNTVKREALITNLDRCHMLEQHPEAVAVRRHEKIEVSDARATHHIKGRGSSVIHHADEL